MNRSARRAMATYGAVKVKTGVNTADPGRLVTMLFEGCVEFLAACEGHIERGDIEGRTNSINRASSILFALIDSLDHEQGGELADNLRQVYGYCLRRLSEANLHNDVEAVREVRELIGGLLESWRTIAEPVVEPSRPVGLSPQLIASLEQSLSAA